MTPEQMLSVREKERQIFKAELPLDLDPKHYILMLHLYIEHLLERFITAKLKRTKGLLGKGGLGFEKKILLTQALGGLPGNLEDQVKKLNALRNNCAHQFRFKPSEAELDAYCRTFGKAYLERKKQYPKQPLIRFKLHSASLAGVLVRNVIDAEHEIGK
jgi:hypothetical protein